MNRDPKTLAGKRGAIRGMMQCGLRVLVGKIIPNG